MSEVQAVLVDTSDGIMTITLNRPQVKNAINNAMAGGVAVAMDELDGNDDIRVAIITGAGSSFCANGPLAVKISKQIMVESTEWSGKEMWQNQAQLVDSVLSSEDVIEGATAFAERRIPDWKAK